MAAMVVGVGRVTELTPAGGGQWAMDNGQCENLADDTMASYHEVPYL